ncbi:MAG: hypothetical protein NZ693_11980, partial [Thermoflexales bacterium]|nr:hypothetical protein [Thermoflexales bacterium]
MASVSSWRVDWVNLLRFDYWLDPQSAQRPASALVWGFAVVSAACAGAWLVLVAQRRVARWQGLALALAFGMSSLVALGRALNIPVLGARVGWLGAALVGLAPFGVRWAQQAHREGVWRDLLNAVAFAPARKGGDWSARTAFAWIALHGVGLCVVAVNLNLPIAVGVGLWASLGVIWGAGALCRALRGMPLERWQLSAFAPLGWAYLATVLFFAGFRVEGVLNGVFSPLLALIVSGALSLVLALRGLAGVLWRAKEDAAFVTAGAAALAAATLGWSVWTAHALRAHGVAGSDPYAYAQMGIDLVTRGSVLHPFPLAEIAYRLVIPVYPVVHVGYRLPDPVTLEAATVWPPGYAVFTGTAYALFGEDGLYWVTPVVNLLALLVVGALALAATGGRSAKSIAVAALAVALSATSLEQVRWQMVPMADLAVQGLTALSLTLALSANGSPWRTLLSGLCLGAAFDVRYTQVLAAPAVALAIYLGSPKRAAWLIALCAGGAWLAALPVLAYHLAVFGNPFVTGSEELAHFSLALAPETARQALVALGSHREFGLLAPWMAIGVAAAWRAHRRALVVFALVIGILGGFHALYPYLRLRDLLFLFPMLSWLAALGMVSSFTALLRRATLLRAALVFSLSFVMVLRSMETLALPVTRGFEVFGRLIREQRAALDQLSALTSPDAVVGCSLNSGAVALYARRQTFRPAGWSADALLRFVGALHEAQRPVFILDDGEEMAGVLSLLRQRYLVRPVRQLSLPFYDAVGGGSKSRQVWLYQ